MSQKDDLALDLQDSEGLPWLEPASSYDDDDDDVIAPGKLIALVLGGLVLIGTVLGGLWLLQGGRDQGQGELIAAQQGEYKVVPDDDQARRFEGEGGASFAASAGAEPNGRVDPSRLPEEPLIPARENKRSASAPAASAPTKALDPKSAPAVTAPNVAERVVAKAPVSSSKAPATPVPTPKATPKPKVTPVPKTMPAATVPATPATAGGATIQLGAFSSQESAQQAWTGLTRRFAYLAPLNRDISRAEVNGAAVYRLRAGAGSARAAAELCGKLKVAGESCAIVR